MNLSPDVSSRTCLITWDPGFEIRALPGFGHVCFQDTRDENTARDRPSG